MNGNGKLIISRQIRRTSASSEFANDFIFPSCNLVETTNVIINSESAEPNLQVRFRKIQETTKAAPKPYNLLLFRYLNKFVLLLYEICYCGIMDEPKLIINYQIY